MWFEEVENELKDGIIPFWLNMQDKENGGFYGYLSFDLQLDKKADKGCILNSRILWFFSNAYLLLKDEALLTAATAAYRFLADHAVDREYGGVYWSMTYDGKPSDTMKHTYNQAFAVYGLSSYYAASKDKQALELAYELVDVIEQKCTDAGGYLESFNRVFEENVNEKLSENGVIAHRTMNTLLHVFEAYSELYRVDHRKCIKDKICSMLDLFADKMYNRELMRQEVFFDANYHSLLDLHSYGHDIETAWLIDRGVAIIHEPSYEKKMAPITEAMEGCVYRLAFDGAALYNECENGVNDTKRVWWVQAESVVGFINAYKKNPEKMEYLKAAETIWAYIHDVMIDKRSGSEWFSEVEENGKPIRTKAMVDEWKCPYHNGRMCIEVIKRIKDIQEV